MGPKWFSRPGTSFLLSRHPCVCQKSFETSLQFLISRKYSRVTWVLLEVWALPCLPPHALLVMLREQVFISSPRSLTLSFSHIPSLGLEHTVERGGSCQLTWPHPVPILHFGILTVSTVETTKTKRATGSQERQKKTQIQVSKAMTR